MIRIAALAALALVAACGADGPPLKPSLNTSISVGTGGVTTSTTASVRKGPVTVALDL
ncbi:hypothetical protein [Pseudoprimorskyibacter insulae]|uniref:Argininosuccinate lyase n=1 Tax=Pseudoprimorskyibacter insulae TaxID=1695997 RepID=A0A2R8AUW6_9RHOB|nr:hypothetical protein [Pseudoprimorskyibacter insulae]SPF79806.1 hypothetical protein PRI8871_01604 [Pseudoprimorskyibacter insulae]